MNDTITTVSSSSNSLSFLILNVFCLLLVIATKALIFKWFTKQQPLKPMDYLILIDELEKFCGFLFLCIGYLVVYKGQYDWEWKLLPPESYLKVFGYFGNICLVKMVTVGLFAQMFLGGLGISVMRFLYIRCGNLVQCYGEWKLSFFIFLITQLCTIIFIFSFRNNVHPGQYVTCRDISSQYVLNFDPLHIMVLAIFISVIEFAIYLSLSHHIHKHDKSMQNFISKSSFKRRRRENAISFTAHFVHFLLEMGLVFLRTNDYLRNKYLIVLGYAPISIVTVICSLPLRREMFNTYNEMLNIVKMVFCRATARTISKQPESSEIKIETPASNRSRRTNTSDKDRYGKSGKLTALKICEQPESSNRKIESSASSRSKCTDNSDRARYGKSETMRHSKVRTAKDTPVNKMPVPDVVYMYGILRHQIQPN